MLPAIPVSSDGRLPRDISPEMYLVILWGMGPGEALAESLLDLRNQTGVSKRVAKPKQP